MSVGLFDRKFCDICGSRIGFLGNRKLEDGNLCKECAGKLSPFFRGRRRSTVGEIRAQLTYREENSRKLADFHPDLVFGTDEKVYLDLKAKKLLITGSDDFRKNNPDIIDAAQIISCEKHIEENREEIFTTDKDGNEKSYTPPRYQYAYEFHITLQIDSPWFQEISVDLNNGNRPDRKDSDLYLEQEMQLSELISCLHRWRYPELQGNHQLGPDVYIMNMRKNAVPMGVFPSMEKEAAASAEGWKCICGTVNSRNFCTECGKARP